MDIIRPTYQAFHFDNVDLIGFIKNNRFQDNIWIKYIDQHYLIVQLRFMGPNEEVYNWFFLFLEGVEEGIAKTYYKTELREMFRSYVGQRMNNPPKESLWDIAEISGKKYKWVMIHPKNSEFIVWPKLEVE